MIRNIKSRKWLTDKSRSRNGEPPQQRPPPQQEQEITPSSGWTQDSTSHYLLLELPDFKQDEIKVQFEGTDRVKISGERKAGGDKTIYFDKTYDVPNHADVELTSSKLQGGVFTVTIPKRLEPIQEIISAAEENNSADKEFGDGGWEKESNGEHVNEKLEDIDQEHQKSAEEDSSSRQRNQLNNAAKMICKSKNTIFLTVIAFCLGVLVSRKIGH